MQESLIHRRFAISLRRCFSLIFSLALVGAASSAFTKDFTQADLDKMVAALDKVLPHNPKYKYPIKCSIEVNADVNAYATLTKEGKDFRSTMVVYTGLVKAIGGDERLIRAVIAHELSHLSLGHNLDMRPAARDLKNLWIRQHEFAADKSGADALVKAGYAKKDMVDMLLFLDKDQGRGGDWLGKLTADHADPKARAAEIAADPLALNALILYDTGLAYEDARAHLYAKSLFDLAAKQWPALSEACINSAKCSLLFYYDNLPAAVRSAWWRPDFGPMITDVHTPLPQAVEVTDSDREAWKDAMASIKLAIAKNPLSKEAESMLALAQVLEPDAKKDVVQLGIDWFKMRATITTLPLVKLRYSNNAGVGYQRIGNLQAAYDTIIAAQRATTKFNAALAENLGLVVVKGRSQNDDQLAADVLFTWLSDTPTQSPRWYTVKKTFDEVCTKAGITPKPITQKAAILCTVTSLTTGGKELGILVAADSYTALLGMPELRTSFTKLYPDLTEVRWHAGNVAAFTERGKIMRVTSYEPNGFLTLRPIDKTSQATIQIKVGMTKADLFKVLDEKSSVAKDLARAGDVEAWTYFPELNMGVLFDKDVVKAITVSPVYQEN